MSEKGACICAAARWLVPLPSTTNSVHVAQLLARALCPVLAVLEHWVLQLSTQESLNVQSQFCHSGLTTCLQSFCFHTQLVLSPEWAASLWQARSLQVLPVTLVLLPWSARCVILSYMGHSKCCVTSGKGKYTSELVPRRFSQNSVEDYSAIRGKWIKGKIKNSPKTERVFLE